VAVYYTIDIDEVYNDVDRIGNPGSSLTAALDAALNLVFTASQADVDVLTGALKASGRINTATDQNDWKGSVSYGDLSQNAPGGDGVRDVNVGVNYAFYEWRRGGTHDFFRSAPLFEDSYGTAIIDGHYRDYT